LFIFGKVLANLGYVQGNFAEILLPGVVALNGFLGALQSRPCRWCWIRVDTGDRDRYCADADSLVAVEKMVFGAFRGVLSALVMAPIGFSSWTT